MNQLLHAQIRSTSFASCQNDVLELGMFFNYVLHNGQVIRLLILFCNDPGSGSRKLNQMANFVLAVSVNKKHGNATNFLDGEIGEDELVPVGDLNEYPVPGGNTKIHQANGQSVCLIPGLLKGKPLLFIHKGLLIGIDVSCLVQKVTESQTRPPAKLIVLFCVCFFVGYEPFKEV